MTEELWKTTIAQIKDSLPESDFSSWFTRLVFGGEEDGKVTLYVPSTFFKDKFEESFKELIQNTMSELGGQNYSILLEVKKDAQKLHSDKKSDETSKTEPSFSSSSNAQSAATDQRNKSSKPSVDDMMFNPSYTFESFVPGDNSNFAYSACMAIAKNPGSAYNPCLLYGGVGLGKTHLIQSIGNYIKKNTKQKVVYVTAENFTNEYIQALRELKTQQFKNKYRKVSVLLMDDIQFLQKKAETQNELFNTFNDLYDTGRQIVFTCDRPVEELKDITDRLRSRFERGLNIDLLPPNYETRVAILRKKCQEKSVIFSDEVLDYIATNISSNVRALESCLTKLIAYCQLLNKDISLETAKEQLKHIISSNNDTSGISIDLIIRIVANYFNVSVSDIKGKNKNQSVVLPRQIAMYLCRKLTDYSTTEIGNEFDGKNHTTVMYNVQKMEARLKSSEKEINGVIDKLETQIKLESRK
ncbi:MAG: chromosomal replication initiator protein DnaA [Spirochaetales bacterium]|nr:chromosomal replication initiator protein DnaA [Spirochaetales bacterium]